jgi:hypothetical protein
MIRSIFTAAVLALTTLASPAAASTLLFNYTSIMNPASSNFSFKTSDRPVVAQSDEYRFMYDISGFQFGNQTLDVRLTFYVEEADNMGTGGLDVTATDSEAVFGSLFGTQLFQGTTAKPTLITGTFNVTNGFYPETIGTLVVSDIGGAVPEPATWAMMIGGMGMVGGAMRRRTRTLALAA